MPSSDVLILLPQPAKSVRFLTDDDSPPTRPRTTSWSAGSQVHPNSHRGPPPLEVWAPSLTMGRDGPGIVLKEGKVSVPWKGHDTTTSDLTSNPQRPILLQPSLSAVSAQFSPSRCGRFSMHEKEKKKQITVNFRQTLVILGPFFLFPGTECRQRIWPRRTRRSVYFKGSSSSSTGQDLTDGS